MLLYGHPHKRLGAADLNNSIRHKRNEEVDWVRTWILRSVLCDDLARILALITNLFASEMCTKGM